MRPSTIRIALLIVQLVVVPTLTVNLLISLPTLPVQAQVSSGQKVEADRLLEQMEGYLARKQYELAVEFGQQALVLYRKIYDRHGEVKTLVRLGASYGYLRQYEKEIAFFGQALLIFKELQDENGQASMLLALGNAHAALLQYKQAAESLQAALPLWQKLTNMQGEAYTLVLLGDSFRALSQYENAIQALQQALWIYNQLDNPNEKAKILQMLGGIFNEMNQGEKGLVFYQQSLSIYIQLDNRREQADILNQMGLSYEQIGQYSKAINSFQHSLSIFKAINERNRQAIVLLNLANLYRLLNQADQSIELSQQALPLFQAVIDLKGQAISLLNIGNGHFALGAFSKAEAFCQQALPIFVKVDDHKGQATALMCLGATYFATERFSDATNVSQKALSIYQMIGDLPGQASVLNNFGTASARQSQLQQAMKFYRQSLLMYESVGARDSQGGVLTNIGILLLETNQIAAAETALNKAVGIWESLRPGLIDENKISLAEKQQRTYKFLQAALIRQNKPEVALEIAERGRARAFVELLAKRLNPTQAEIKIPPPTIQQIRHIAKQQNATLVQYSVMGDHALFIWVIQPNGTITFRQVAIKPASIPAIPDAAQAELTQLVTDTRRSLGITGSSRNSGSLAFQPDPSQARKQLRRLHQLLIEPIADLLPSDSNQAVIFVPHGALFFVPFPALQDGNGKYLIEKHTMLTAPSIQILALTRQQKSKAAKTGTVLVVGNPIMPKNLAPLPGAELEAKNIAQLLNTQPLLGAQATKATVVQKMPQARIIHLATHGLFNSTRGLGSSVALTPSGKDNGFLTAEDILNLKLSADLVVLSACDTGKGQLTADGVIGLSRSLIAAGSPSILVSLWTVEDNSTAFLMTEFYRILQHQPNKAKALRQAMLTTMNSYSNPIQWAAFTLIGESE